MDLVTLLIALGAMATAQPSPLEREANSVTSLSADGQAGSPTLKSNSDIGTRSGELAPGADQNQVLRRSDVVIAA